MAAGGRILGHGAGFVPGRDEGPPGAFEIAVLDLANEVEDLAHVPALMISAPEARQENVFEGRVLEEIARLAGSRRRRRQVARRLRLRLLLGLGRAGGRGPFEGRGDQSEIELFPGEHRGVPFERPLLRFCRFRMVVRGSFHEGMSRFSSRYLLWIGDNPNLAGSSWCPIIAPIRQASRAFIPTTRPRRRGRGVPRPGSTRSFAG